MAINMGSIIHLLYRTSSERKLLATTWGQNSYELVMEKKHFKAIGSWGTISEVMRTNSIPSAVIKHGRLKSLNYS
jgi:hypothetical protein